MLEEEYNATHRPKEAQRNLPPLEVPFEYTIRDATLQDIPDIREIYNHYVANSSITFDEKPLSLKEFRAKFLRGSKIGMPFLVAETPSEQILGFAMVYPWQGNIQNRRVVENSIYLRAASTSKGLGRVLMGELIERCRAAGIKEMIAIIADKGAEASIRMHETFGFKQVGQMGKVGFKFDRWLGTVMMQKKLKK
ncbi:GNAT family N-acetyltransferase [soil metagenome]